MASFAKALTTAARWSARARTPTSTPSHFSSRRTKATTRDADESRAADRHRIDMPLVRIALRKGTKPQFRRAIGHSIHRALVETIKIPEQDRFQILTEPEPDGLI